MAAVGILAIVAGLIALRQNLPVVLLVAAVVVDGRFVNVGDLEADELFYIFIPRRKNIPKIL